MFARAAARDERDAQAAAHGVVVVVPVVVSPPPGMSWPTVSVITRVPRLLRPALGGLAQHDAVRVRIGHLLEHHLVAEARCLERLLGGAHVVARHVRDGRGLRAFRDGQRDDGVLAGRAARAGLWSMTVFAGWSLETKCGLTWKPAACSVEVAWSIGRRRTFGTAIGCGPFETLIRTDWPTGDLRARRRILRGHLPGRLARVDRVHVGLQLQLRERGGGGRRLLRRRGSERRPSAPRSTRRS